MTETPSQQLRSASPSCCPPGSLPGGEAEAPSRGALEDRGEMEKHGVLTAELVSSSVTHLGRFGTGLQHLYHHLSLPNHKLSDISVLCNYVHLQKLELPHNKIKDLSCVSNMPYLVILDASHNEISNFFGFQPPKNLKEVNFSHNHMTKMKDLSAYSSLSKLDLDYNSFSEIIGLEHCCRLTHLSLANNKISRISGLDGLPLTHLCLRGNQLERIEGMENLRSLQVLDLSLNRISSLSGLQNLHLLGSVNLEKNLITEIQEYKHIHDLLLLRDLNLLGNPVQEQQDYRPSVVFLLQHLTVLDQEKVTAEEKVSSVNKYDPPMDVVAARNHMTHLVYQLMQPQVLYDSTLPSADSPYPMLVLTGPQGCGKRELTHRLCQELSEYFAYGTCHTTRGPYFGEENGIDYHFVSEEDFQNMIHMGKFIQTMQYGGYRYGLTRDAIEDVAREGLACCVHMELEGVFSLKNSYFEPRYILLIPTQVEKYTDHLKSRGLYTAAQIDMAVSRIELYANTNRQRPGFFDNVIPCDDWEEAYQTLRQVVRDYLLLEEQEGESNNRASPDNTSTASSHEPEEKPLSPLLRSGSGTLRSHSATALDPSDPSYRNYLTKIQAELSPQKSPAELASIRRREQLVREAIVGKSPGVYSQLFKSFPQTAPSSLQNHDPGTHFSEDSRQEEGRVGFDGCRVEFQKGICETRNWEEEQVIEGGRGEEERKSMGCSSVWIFLLSLSLSHQRVTAQTEACRTVVQADIVFLVDESWGVGQTSFSSVKGFISAVISSFQDSVVGAEGVRFGVTVFGDVPRMRIALTDYSSLEEVLRAIRDLPYEGGSRRIGDALQFLVDHVFSPAISRDHAPKIAVLITNGRSDDQVDAPARAVADNGISLFALGVRGADDSELRRIVSEPHEEHLLVGADYSLLEAVLPKLTRRVCFTASEPPRPVKTSQPVEERVVGPRDLQVSELAHSSLRLTWTQATGDVTGYRLLVAPLTSKGHLLHPQQRQIDLKADVSTALVTELSPKTDYSLTVYAIYPSLIGDSVTITIQTTPLPQVSNFRVIEEGLFSLRLGWTPPLGKLSGFKIFIPRSNRPGFTYEQLLPGDTSSHVIDSLEEDKKYTISIYAVYPQGPSEPVSIVGKTLKLVPVQQFLVQNATTDTVQARWASVKGATGYRLTWASPDHIENINLGDTFNFYMIQGLHPGSEYTVTINPIFGDIEGPVTTTKVKTLESSAVQTLKVSAVTTSAAVISWNSVPGATGYRLAWGPTPEFVGRDRPRQLALNGSTTEYQLKNVAHDTEYVLTLYVLFGSVVGPGISATFRTSPLGYVSNFKVTSYTSTSIDVEWSPIVGATEYKLSWNTDDSSPQSRYLDRSVLSHRIEDLNPQSTYTITIRAVYGNSEGPEISLSHLTAAASDSEQIQAVRGLKVVDIGVNFFTLSWRKTPGASAYKISWIPFLGGDEKSHVVPAASTTFTIHNLQESSAYKIQVSSMVANREGSPVLVTARTLDLPKVNGFAALDTTDNSTVLNWTRVAGVSGYLLSWRHISVLETKTETLGPGFTSFKISELLYGRTYIFTIRPLYGEVEGPVSTVYQRILGQDAPVVKVQSVSATVAPRSALITTASQTASITKTTNAHTATRTTRHPIAVPAIQTVTTKKPPGQPSVTEAKAAAVTSLRLTTFSPETKAPPQPVCGKTVADIVFLVDESSSIGPNNFIKMKDFIFRVVTYFPVIGPQGTQIAVVHYSDEPRIEFRLSDFKDRNSALRALRALRYGGGNTKTGKGISYVLQELFQESLGMRQDVAHVLVLITDGRAQDNVLPPSRIARALGVSVLAVGVSNADTDELNKIAAPTTYKNIFFSPTFDDFPSIEREFINSICSEELLSEFKQHDEFAQLDTPTEDPEELLKPQGPCPSQCVKGQKGEKGDGFGVGGLRFRQSPGQYDPFTSSKGEKGERGPPGTDGIPGLPGRPGRTGPPGSAGQRGPPGIPGDMGHPGLTGPKGQRGERGEPGYVIAGTDSNFVPGRKGEPGSSGPQGPPGVPGVNGAPGLPGQSGPPGSPGISVKGDPGDPGAKGLRGKQGVKGDKGEPGKDGIAGLPGPIGIDGVPGFSGQKGEKGEEGIGIQGIQGPRGEPGEKGNIGLMGPVGPKGDRGEQGIQGIIGPRGKKGFKGEQGDKGDRGEMGPIGPQGPTGFTGPIGLKGDEGPRGAPGDPAKGILGPTGKKGARGDIGPVGPTGPQGIKGERGDKGEKGNPGFGIPGQQGPKGENGERGNVGLSGKPGPKGHDGSKGDKGNIGLPGNPGEPGLRGKDGASGTRGDQGVKGEQGPPGEPGDRGIRGPLGLPGRPGDPGEKGDNGKTGLPGTDGKKGDKGEPGKPGPPGTQIVADNNVLTRVIKGEPGEPGQPGLRGETGLPGPRGPEGKPGLPGPSLGGSGRDGLDGLPGKSGVKGEQGQKGEPGPRGEKGDQGRVGIAGMPGLPGTPGKPGIDGKRGLAGKDGERGPNGDDGQKGDKGDAGANGKDGSKGEPGPPGLPGRQVLVTPEGATMDDLRQAFPIPMGPPGAPGSPGMKGDKGEQGLTGEKGDAGAPGKSTEMKDIEIMFEAYGIRLPLLKALIDRLLQDGIEELLHVLGTTKKTKENKETHTSNVIAEYTSSVKFDLTSQPLSELATTEDPDLDGQFPESLSVEPSNETAEGPTLWTLTTLDREQELNTTETKLKGKKIIDGDSNEVSSLIMNLTVVRSPFNYTAAQETVSELPETMEEKVLLTQEDTLKKNTGQKKKNRERGKTSEEDKQEEEEGGEEEEEEFYNGEEYSYEYEEELPTDDPSVLQQSSDHRELEVQTHEFPHPVDKKEEQLPTHTPVQIETSADTSSRTLTAQAVLSTTEPLSQPVEDIEKDEVSLPTPPITTEEPHKDIS